MGGFLICTNICFVCWKFLWVFGLGVVSHKLKLCWYFECCILVALALSVGVISIWSRTRGRSFMQILQGYFNFVFLYFMLGFGSSVVSLGMSSTQGGECLPAPLPCCPNSSPSPALIPAVGGIFLPSRLPCRSRWGPRTQ